MVFIVNMQNIMCTLAWPKEPSTKMLNMCCVAGLSSLLSIYLIHKVTGNWRGTLRTITTYPALVLFPIVGFFTFGKVQDKASQPSHGLALTWKWTFVNMLMSFGVTTVLHMHDMEQINLRYLNMSVQKEAIDSPGAWWHMGWSQASYIREDINEKKYFLSGIARMRGGGLPMPEFFTLFQEVRFWSIKRVFFFKNANVLNF